jgi:hypothetical protein
MMSTREGHPRLLPCRDDVGVRIANGAADGSAIATRVEAT